MEVKLSLCLQHMVQGMLMMHAGAASAAAAGECPGHGLSSLLHPLTPHPAAMHFHRSGTQQLLTVCRLVSAVVHKSPIEDCIEAGRHNFERDVHLMVYIQTQISPTSITRFHSGEALLRLAAPGAISSCIVIIAPSHCHAETPNIRLRPMQAVTDCTDVVTVDTA